MRARAGGAPADSLTLHTEVISCVRVCNVAHFGHLLARCFRMYVSVTLQAKLAPRTNIPLLCVGGAGGGEQGLTGMCHTLHVPLPLGWNYPLR